MNFDEIIMTPYFRDEQDIPDNFFWSSWIEFQKEIEQTWEEIKQQVIDNGHIEMTPEGWLKGHGHPNSWFDSVNISKFDGKE